MIKSLFLLTIGLVLTLNMNAQDAAIGDFKEFTHVGNPGKKGTVQYDAGSQEYTLEGASGNMWDANDDFHFLWKKMKGDFILTAQTEFLSKGVDPHRKVGWMVRGKPGGKLPTDQCSGAW